ncbi:MAG: sulfite exporter TauE/SafE family protein [Proteobacteria bacterium]|nr:sulfite exporter TauE/SafE family protein [Pseudomonadota bacterium]MCL2307077.1 sulfite exporter TauE/SafE family protein [Pseudomonadota bacterium]
MDYSNFSPIVALFLMGLVGSGGHCVFMCSPIVAALSLNTASRRWLLVVGYNLGRIITYTLMGALFGALGLWLAQRVGALFQVQQLLTGIAALFMLLIAVHISGLYTALAPLERLGGRLWQKIQPLAQRLLPIKNFPGALALGSLWGFIPCGMVYAALAASLAGGGALEGGALMLAFGLGTLPVLAVIGLAAGGLGRWLQNVWVKRLAGIIIAALAAWMFAQMMMKSPPNLDNPEEPVQMDCH